MLAVVLALLCAASAPAGTYQAIIEVDGVPVVQQGAGCSKPFVAVVPCKPATSGTITLDTATLADGPHSVRVLITDATETNTAAFGPFTITTSNAPTTCAPAESPNLSVRFDRKRRTISYGGRLRVIGQAPPGARCASSARSAAPAKLGRTPLTADAQGRFTYKVPAGPRAACASPTARPRIRSTSARERWTSCRARVTLRASPRSIRSGERVRFSGRLRGGYVPGNGKVVELQAHERGRWRTFRTVRTSRKGAFSYRYRFSFRAGGRVRADGSYPFALGTSRRVRVRVR